MLSAYQDIYFHKIFCEVSAFPKIWVTVYKIVIQAEMQTSFFQPFEVWNIWSKYYFVMYKSVTRFAPSKYLFMRKHLSLAWLSLILF